MAQFKMEEARRGGRSTTVVLWLMILVVFAPIAAMHGIARLLETGPRSEVLLR